MDADGRIEDAQVRGERLEVECARRFERIEQPPRVGDRERRERGREGVVVQQRKALLRGEREVAEQTVREIRVRGEIGLAVRAQQPDLGNRAVVQRGDDVLDELEPDARASAGESVREPQRHSADDLLRRRGPLAHAVLEDQPPVERILLGLGHRDALAHAHSGVESVDALPAGQVPVDDRAPAADALSRLRRQHDVLARARDTQDLVQRQSLARDGDGHEAT